MPTDFELHPQLQADTLFVGDWPLCRVLLMNDANYPWLILVPRRSGVREIYELGPDDRALLLQESCIAGEAMMRLFAGDKLNVAALGNVVPQLHVHHVVRRTGDPAWPAPVWGRAPSTPYIDAHRAGTLHLLRSGLARARGAPGWASVADRASASASDLIRTDEARRRDC